MFLDVKFCLAVRQRFHINIHIHIAFVKLVTVSAVNLIFVTNKLIYKIWRSGRVQVYIMVIMFGGMKNK